MVNEIKILLVSMLPVLEQKASIVMGVNYGISHINVFLITLLGVMVPVPFIYFTVIKILPFFKKVKYIKDIIFWVEKRTMSQSERIIKYELIGLFFFVAIPLPGTGVWTGTLAAAFLELDFKKSMFVIFLGAVVCGLILIGGTDVLMKAVNWIM